ncbi:hypothetical protein [Methylobacterium iners]|uniref:Uncharacterized protein n=1 Tax=Methylobacterium iners TaxID=418707 RepID=A0ABQ4S4S9_9HYPH|nr:hypothetical protein [Methylobacterium iners]GJD96899.1 hypothetical protein OCOJLMKI_4126 [Methylobacterium iners]
MAEKTGATFGELYKANAITEEDLVAAVNAFMTDRTTAEFAIGGEYVLDLAAAVQASPFAMRMLNDPAFKDGSRRSAVRTAILLARPVKG